MSLFDMKTSENRGFTLIEVIAVLIILGIVAAVAVSRVTYNESDLIPQTDILKSHLRYAQLKALQDDPLDPATGNQIDSWTITFSGGNSYSLTCAGANCPTVQLPSESNNSHSFSTYNVTVTSSISPINIDCWGSPGATDIVITLTQGGASKAFRFKAITGYIEDI